MLTVDPLLHPPRHLWRPLRLANCLRVCRRTRGGDIDLPDGDASPPRKHRNSRPRHARYLKVLSAAMRQAAGIRRLAAAALDLAYVAAGRFAVFFELGLSPWDVAAGSLLVEEAGGKVTEPTGGSHPIGSGSDADDRLSWKKAGGRIYAPHPGTRKAGLACAFSSLFLDRRSFSHVSPPVALRIQQNR